MSSLFAHAAVGMALAGRGRQACRWRLATAAAALAPDLDYALLWIGGIHMPIRYTHSAGFCLCVAALGATALRLGRDPDWRSRSLRIAVAAFSHLVLDALVGVFPEPWLWPISAVTFRLPFGILPSAGRFAWGNVYLYRNLAIEAGLLGPIIWMGMRGKAARPAAIACGSALALGAAAVGLNLGRG